jgi:ribonuclease Y
MLEAALALVAGLVLGAAVVALVLRNRDGSADALLAEAGRELATARREADAVRKEAEVAAKEHMLAARSEVEEQLKGRSLDVARAEERLGVRASQLDQMAADLAARESRASERDVARTEREGGLAQLAEQRERELERVAGMTQAQAREALLARVQEQARHDVARRIRTIEDEARHDSDRRVRNIISIGIQRTASAHAASTTVSSVQLPSDEMKGRIIGREGRNIRALENLTGVDVIIDDTPGAVLLSGFDGMRREIARLTLTRLIADGRIHPARIEECYGQAKTEVEEEIVRAGEQASFDAKVPGLHPELLKVLGRLRYRTSYGQNVLSHSVEVAHVAAIMAAELGASQKTARRAALLHDVGKALTHEVEGSHAIIGAQLARKHRESAAVVHAIEAHHFEVEPQTIEAVLVQAADAISAARPGARGESMEHYAKRLEDLERIATSRPGVERCFAMQAGRDVRVMVKPEMIDDDAATVLSHEIAREIEDSLEYPGQIRVTVIRELRATDVAR